MPALVLAAWVGLVPSLVADVGIIALLYRLTPAVPGQPGPALAAGALASVLWEISKIVFGWWVLNAGTYNRVYGPLAATVIVMLWLWISAMVFLFGAELTVALHRGHMVSAKPPTQ